MDPLTALGVASNALSFVDFALKLIKGSQAIYKSFQPGSNHTAFLDTIARDCRSINDRIIHSFGCSKELESIIEKTKEIANELQDALGKLMVQGRKTRWKSFLLAIKEVMTHRDVEDMSNRLQMLQSHISMHLQLLVSNGIASISTQLDQLKGMSATYDLKMDGNIRALHEQLVRSVENLIHRKLDDVFRSMAAGHQLMTHVAINKVEDLAAAIASFSRDIGTIGTHASKNIRDWRLLQALHFDNIWTRHDRIASAHSDTFTWIFKGVLPDTRTPIGYVDWLRRRNGIFWIHGKPGSGKSTLMKFLVHHRDTDSHLTSWANGRKLLTAKYFFWNSGTELQKSQEGLLRSLLFDILRQSPALLPGVYDGVSTKLTRGIPKFTEYGSSDGLTENTTWSTLRWDLDTLRLAFTYLRTQDLGANFCFFIDGLDEYKDEVRQDPRELIQALRDLSSSPYMKICVSSRSWTVFRDAFGENPATTIRLEDLTRNDIRRYVSDNFNAHDQFHGLALLDPAYAQLVEEVVSKSQGVFLWVFLVVRELLDGLTYNDAINTMRLRLNKFPKDLDSYFRHIFDSIPEVYRPQTSRTFQIALSRDEPLPLLTYSFVDDVEADPSLSFNTALILDARKIEMKLARMWRQLDGRSKGLLEVVVTERQRRYRERETNEETETLGPSQRLAPRSATPSPNRSKHIEGLGSQHCPVEEENGANSEVVFAVEFLHRTVRDFLLHTPDIHDQILGDMNKNGETWLLLCRATSLVIRHWPQNDISYYLRQIFYFARLATTDSGDDAAADSVLADILLSSGRLKENMTRLAVGRKPQNMVFLDICLASEHGLLSYVKKRTSEARRLTDVTSAESVGYWDFLGRVLHHALLSEDSHCKLSPELVEYLLSEGASPNYRPPKSELFETVFVQFMLRIKKGRILPGQPGVLEIMKALLAHHASLDQHIGPSRSRGNALGSAHHTAERTRDVISKHFSGEQNAWLLSHASEADRPLSTSTEDNDSRQNNHKVQRVSEGGDKKVVIVGSQSRETGPDPTKGLYGEQDKGDLAPKRGFSQHPTQRIQCYNCQRMGHRANKCRSPKVCAKCAATGHHHTACRAVVLKCALCGGPHASFGNKCPTFSSAQ